MAIKEDVQKRAPRGTKVVTQAFFAALDGIPGGQQADVGAAALAAIRDELKGRQVKSRESAVAAKASAKAKAPTRKNAPAKRTAPAKAATKPPAGRGARKAAAPTRRAPAAASKQAATKKVPAKKVVARKARQPKKSAEGVSAPPASAVE